MSEPLFQCLPQVTREIRSASRLLLGLDFDGTLAPIVPQPASARMPDETWRVLEALTRRPGVTLAIVSGRTTEDLRARIGPGIALAGNHGLEIMLGDGHWRHPDAVKRQPLLHEICGELSARVEKIPGALLEDKGLTASIHHRNVAPVDVAGLSAMVRSVVTPHADRFLVRRGQRVMEILPRVAWNKGSAIAWIIERLRQTEDGHFAVCCIGDDATDEAAFRELPRAITVRVGTNSPTLARFRVRDTRQVFEFLNWLQSECWPDYSTHSPGGPSFQPQP